MNHKRREYGYSQMLFNYITDYSEEELHFSCKAQCAKYFGLKPNTVIRWLDNGMPVIELLTDIDRNQVEIEKQSKLNGFELFTINEWSVFDN